MGYVLCSSTFGHPDSKTWQVLLHSEQLSQNSPQGQGSQLTFLHIDLQSPSHSVRSTLTTRPPRRIHYNEGT
ncbi:hypothetical protein K523DRAFT_325742 [Schizophyllum commune Tattone D]|nr:hypothetical protein K523DRAFT_325742 [Schizophyllum commune Tattone D]